MLFLFFSLWAVVSRAGNDGSVTDSGVTVSNLESACIEGRGEWLNPAVPSVPACCQYDPSETETVFDWYWEFSPQFHFVLPNGMPQVPNPANPNNVYFKNGSLWHLDGTYWFDITEVPAPCKARGLMTSQFNIYALVPPQLSFGERSFVGTYNPHIYFSDYEEQRALTPTAKDFDECCIALPEGIRTEVNCETLRRMVEPLPENMQPEGYVASNKFYVSKMGNHLSYPQHVASPWVGINGGEITFFSADFLVSDALVFIRRAAATIGCIAGIPLQGEKDVCYEECFDIPWNEGQVMPKEGYYPTRLCKKYTFAFTMRQAFDRFQKFPAVSSKKKKKNRKKWPKPPTQKKSFIIGNATFCLAAILLVPSLWFAYAKLLTAKKSKTFGFQSKTQSGHYGAVSA